MVIFGNFVKKKMAIKKGGDKKVAERLLELRDHCRMSSKQMYEEIGIAKGTWSKYTTASVAFDYVFLTDLIDKYDCNPMWLLKGEGPMLLKDIGTGLDEDLAFKWLKDLDEKFDAMIDGALKMQIRIDELEHRLSLLEHRG